MWCQLNRGFVVAEGRSLFISGQDLLLLSQTKSPSSGNRTVWWRNFSESFRNEYLPLILHSLKANSSRKFPLPHTSTHRSDQWDSTVCFFLASASAIQFQSCALCHSNRRTQRAVRALHIHLREFTGRSPTEDLDNESYRTFLATKLQIPSSCIFHKVARQALSRRSQQPRKVKMLKYL